MMKLHGISSSGWLDLQPLNSNARDGGTEWTKPNLDADNFEMLRKCYEGAWLTFNIL